MKTEKNILIAFVLNLLFSIFEFFGGIITGSIAIVSDAIHDIGDAISIGVTYFLERISKKKPDDNYTYGYVRYSVLGSVITTLILLVGSVAVVYKAILRITNPVPISYDGMLVFAIFGVIINLGAAVLTHGGQSLNQKAVSLHMLEDVLGWLVVLIGAIVMRFTDFTLLDSILSICVAVFIFVNAFRTLKESIDLFLEKTPHGINVNEIREHILSVNDVVDVHHIHLWSMDGVNNFATMHVVSNTQDHSIKDKIREELAEHGIVHVTLELETENEDCHFRNCHIEKNNCDCHHHHHH